MGVAEQLGVSETGEFIEKLQITHNLSIMALFFAMRSCSYLVTKYPEENKRTKILRLKNMVFKKDNRIIPLSTPNVPRNQSVPDIRCDPLPSEGNGMKFHLLVLLVVIYL